jgi:hypothetical protein
MSVAQIGANAFTLWNALPVTLSLASLVVYAVEGKFFAPETHPEGALGPNPTNFQIGYAENVCNMEPGGFETFIKTGLATRTGRERAAVKTLYFRQSDSPNHGDLASVDRVCFIFENKMRCIG